MIFIVHTMHEWQCYLKMGLPDAYDEPIAAVGNSVTQQTMIPTTGKSRFRRFEQGWTDCMLRIVGRRGTEGASKRSAIEASWPHHSVSRCFRTEYVIVINCLRAIHRFDSANTCAVFMASR